LKRHVDRLGSRSTARTRGVAVETIAALTARAAAHRPAIAFACHAVNYPQYTAARLPRRRSPILAPWAPGQDRLPYGLVRDKTSGA
jgi:hypothetical protein